MKLNKKIITKKPITVEIATLLVNTASNFECEVKAIAHDKEIDLKSILGLMSLILATGSTIEVIAEGSDAQEAMNAVLAVIE